MKSPSAAMYKLYRLGPIHIISIEQRQTGTDTADTFCRLSGESGVASGPWSLYSKYLDVSVNHNSVARLRDSCRAQVELWKKWTDEHEADLAEFERLREKLNITSV